MESQIKTIPKLNTSCKTRLLLVAVLLFLLGLGLRLFDLDDQPIDFHPTRQLRGAIIARGMYYELSPGMREDSRQKALTFWASTGQYEPPILERIVALGYLILGNEAPWLARVLNTFLWMIGGAALYDLSKRILTENNLLSKSINQHYSIEISALIALAYFLVLPFSVQASRSFQPDPGMVVWIILAAWAGFRWSDETTWKWALLTGLFSGLAIFTKAVAVYTIAGMLIGLTLFSYRDRHRQSWLKTITCILKSPEVWIIILLSIIPTAIYYSGRGVRTAEYLGSWTLSLTSLLVKYDTYLRWLNLVQELLSPIGLLLALLGLFFAAGRIRAMLIGLFFGYFMYGLFLPYQMTSHSYYHLQLVPIFALSMTPVLQVGVNSVFKRGRILKITAIAIASICLIYGSWQALIPLYSRDYRNEPGYWSNIASLLPEDGKIIALTQDYGYRLMYYGWRKVVLWPNRGEIRLSVLRGGEKDFRDFFAKRIDGKSYFLITAFNQFEAQPELKEILNENFELYAKGDGYLIYDLMIPVGGNIPQNTVSD